MSDGDGVIADIPKFVVVNRIFDGTRPETDVVDPRRTVERQRTTLEGGMGGFWGG